MTRHSAAAATIREFVALPSPTAGRAGAGGNRVKGCITAEWDQWRTCLPPTAFVTTAAHPGRPEVLTAWMDAGVIAENDSLATDPDLDRFDERNDPPYSPEFLARYRSAQAARNHSITHSADTELKRVRAASFSDGPFAVMRTWANPRMVRITCPAMVINADADTDVSSSDAQRIYDALASTDKTQCTIDTDHYFATPGARSEQADTIAKWVSKRWR